jgi:hypothetical protein
MASQALPMNGEGVALKQKLTKALFEMNNMLANSTQGALVQVSQCPSSAAAQAAPRHVGT